MSSPTQRGHGRGPARSPLPPWILAGVAGILAGCGTPPVPAPAPLQPIHPLAAELSTAELASETAEIDLGTHEGAAHLVSGWSWNERSRDGTTFVWSTGEESVVELFVARVRPLALRLRCRAHRFGRSAPQGLEVAVGERVVAELRSLGATVATGRFRTDMAVELVNDGPVTLLVET